MTKSKFDSLTSCNDAEWLWLALKRLQMTQTELAKATGYSNKYISDICNSKSPLSYRLKKQVIRLLKEYDL